MQGYLILSSAPIFFCKQPVPRKENYGFKPDVFHLKIDLSNFAQSDLDKKVVIFPCGKTLSAYESIEARNKVFNPTKDFLDLVRFGDEDQSIIFFTDEKLFNLNSSDDFWYY